MTVQTSSADRRRSTARRPSGSKRPAWGSRDVGHEQAAGDAGRRSTIGTLTRKTEPHQKCSSSQPPATGPSATAMPGSPAQTPMALARSLGSVKTLVRMASVAGKMRAAPTPMAARAAISASARSASAASAEVSAEHDQADLHHALAPEPVAEAAGGEQQPGEHQDVGVDDPLQLARRGAELATSVGQRHVDDRVVDTTTRNTCRAPPGWSSGAARLVRCRCEVPGRSWRWAWTSQSSFER